MLGNELMIYIDKATVSEILSTYAHASVSPFCFYTRNMYWVPTQHISRWVVRLHYKINSNYVK